MANDQQHPQEGLSTLMMEVCVLKSQGRKIFESVRPTIPLAFFEARQNSYRLGVQLDCKLQINSAIGQALVIIACFKGERI